jgi:hypothetical protein
LPEPRQTAMVVSELIAPIRRGPREAAPIRCGEIFVYSFNQ